MTALRWTLLLFATFGSLCDSMTRVDMTQDISTVPTRVSRMNL